MKTHAIMVSLFSLLMFAAVFAENSAAQSSTSVSDLSWMAGHWRGEAFGGICEEVWSPEFGGTMVGTFKLVSGKKINFYEIMTITSDSAGPTLNVKHFNPDLTGWEEKDEVMSFSFVSAGVGQVTFSGLTYERTAEDSLRITVSVKGADGSARQEIIECGRIE
jgi:hypothetical protein